MGRELGFTIASLGGLVASVAAFGADAPLLCFGLSALFLSLASLNFALFTAPLGPHSLGLLVTGVAFVLVVMAQAFTGHISVAAPDIAAIAAAAALFLIARRLSLTTDGAYKVISASFVAMGVIAVLAFVDHAISPGEVLGRPKAYHVNRLTAAFLSANTAATLFGFAVILGWGGVLRAVLGGAATTVSVADRLGRKGLPAALLFVFAFTCLLLTGSRSGVGLAFVGLGGLTLWSGAVRKPGMMIPLLIVGAAVLSAMVFVSSDVLLDRVADAQAGGNGRGVLWQASWTAFQQKPFFGHGFGRFTEAIAPTITAETAAVLVSQGAAHNFVLQWLVQTGIVGTLFGGIGVAGLAFAIITGLGRRRRLIVILKSIIVAWAFVMGHGMIDYGLEIPAIVWWLAFILGIGSGISDGKSVPEGGWRA